MALKSTLESLEGVDNALHGFYTETDGRFVLQVEGIDTHPEVANLKSAYERTKADKTASGGRVKELESQLAQALKGKPDEAAVLAIRQELEAERDSWKSQFTEAQSKLTASTRDRALAEALTAAGITAPGLLKGAQAMLAGMVKMEGDKPVFDTDMGPMALGDYVKRWVAGDDGKAFVSAPKGGGATGGNSGKAAQTVKSEAFRAMTQSERMAFSKSGGKVTD